MSHLEQLQAENDALIASMNQQLKEINQMIQEIKEKLQHEN